MEQLTYTGEGYKTVLMAGEWRVAFLRYAERFSRLCQWERHFKTHECFILLSGEGEAKRTYIRAAPVRMTVSYESDIVGIDDLVIKRLQFVVHKCSQHRCILSEAVHIHASADG